MSSPLNLYSGNDNTEHFLKIQELRNELKANRPKPQKFKKPSENIRALKKSHNQSFTAFRSFSSGERGRSLSPKLLLENLTKEIEFQKQAKYYSLNKDSRCNVSAYTSEEIQIPKKKLSSKSFVEEMIHSIDAPVVCNDHDIAMILNSPEEFDEKTGVFKIEGNEKSQMFIIDLTRSTQKYEAYPKRQFYKGRLRRVVYTPFSKPLYPPVCLKKVRNFKIPWLDLSFRFTSKPEMKQCNNHMGDSTVVFDCTIPLMINTPLELSDTLYLTQAQRPEVIMNILKEAKLAPKTPDSSPSEEDLDISVNSIDSLRSDLECNKLNETYAFMMDSSGDKQVEIFIDEYSDYLYNPRSRYDSKEVEQLLPMQPLFPVYSVSKEFEYIPGEYIQNQSETQISPTLNIDLGHRKPLSTYQDPTKVFSTLISDSYGIVGHNLESLHSESTPHKSSLEVIERLDLFPDVYFDLGSPLISGLDTQDEHVKLTKQRQTESPKEINSYIGSPEERLLTDNLLSPDEELSPTFTYNYSDRSENAIDNEINPSYTLRSTYTERIAQFDLKHSEQTQMDLATDSIYLYDYSIINPHRIEQDFSSSSSQSEREEILIINHNELLTSQNAIYKSEEVNRYTDHSKEDIIYSTEIPQYLPLKYQRFYHKQDHDISLDQKQEDFRLLNKLAPVVRLSGQTKILSQALDHSKPKEIPSSVITYDLLSHDDYSDTRIYSYTSEELISSPKHSSDSNIQQTNLPFNPYNSKISNRISPNSKLKYFEVEFTPNFYTDHSKPLSFSKIDNSVSSIDLLDLHDISLSTEAPLKIIPDLNTFSSFEVKIQRFTRSFQTGKTFLILKQLKNSQVTQAKLQVISNRLKISTAKKRICKAVQLYLHTKKHQRAQLYNEILQHCSNLIQKNYRGYRVRKQYKDWIQKCNLAKVKILAMVNGWKVRRIIYTYDLYLRRKQIQDIHAILKLSISKADTPQEFIRSIYSLLRSLKAKYSSHINYYFKTGSWIHLKIESARSLKITSESRLLDKRGDSEQVNLKYTGNLSIKPDFEPANISSQNVLNTRNKTLLLKPQASEIENVSKTSYPADISHKQHRIRKKPEKLKLNLGQLIQNKSKPVQIEKPSLMKLELPSFSYPKSLPISSYISLPFIISKAQEFLKNGKSTQQKLDNKISLVPHFSKANMSSTPCLKHKSLVSKMHTPSFQHVQNSQIIHLKMQPKQKEAKIDILKLAKKSELNCPSILSIKSLSYQTVNDLEMVYKELSSHHVTIEEYFLQFSRVVSNSVIPQYGLNSMFLKDRL